MYKLTTSIFLFAFLLGMVLLSGCAAKSSPADFYLLNTQPLTLLAARDELIGIFPVRVPDYLDRPQIVTRTGKNTLDLDEFHRWAEPVKGNITSILIKNLSQLLQNDKIVHANHNYGLPLRAMIGVDVLSFDGILGGEVILSGRWAIFGADGRDALLLKGFSFREQTNSESYEDYVAALSRTIAALSREIAEELDKLL